MGRTQPPDHPLDPLSAAEIAATTDVVRAHTGFATLSADTRFITMELAEPDKAAVLAWGAGGARPERIADVVMLDRGSEASVEASVSLDSESVISWRVRTDIQPMAVVGELMEAEDLVRDDPRFRDAMARRGITDFSTVQVDAWPAGHFGGEGEDGIRLGRAVAFVRPNPGDSEWAHPVDGVIALIDLNKLEVLRVDDHGVVPIPPESGNFDAAAGAPLRHDIAPLEITQPDGPGFSVDGRVVRWQRWQVHVGFTPREGLVLNQVGYEDGGRLRSILHRASLSEMVVPYGDPSPTHYFKNAFDAGENGVGLAASPLTRGCDCLGEIVYLDADVSDSDGAPVHIPNAICLHEEDVGVLWRHIEWRDGRGEVRRSRRLVISSFSAIGNYDYGFFWYLYQDGTIEYEVKLTGVLSTGAVAPGERARAWRAGRSRASTPWCISTSSTCGSTWTSTASTTRSTRCGRSRFRLATAIPTATPFGRAGAGSRPSWPPAVAPTAHRLAGGRSSTPPSNTGWVSRSPTGWCLATTRCRLPSRMPR